MEIISMFVKLDEKDMAILEVLQKDCSKSKKWIAKKLSLPLTTVHNRIAKLEKEGIISAYKAQLDWKKLGYDISAFIQITVEYDTKNYSQEDTAKSIRALHGVESVSIVAGTTDIIAKVRTQNTEALNDFLLNHLRKIEGIDKTTSIVVLKEFQ